MATNTDRLTTAQIRTMQAIRRTGQAPSNTTAQLLSRLVKRELVGRPDPQQRPTPQQPVYVNRYGQWRLTAAGCGALDRAESEEACQALSARLNGILS
jgi:hypothetical protein